MPNTNQLISSLDKKNNNKINLPYIGAFISENVQIVQNSMQKAR